MKCEKNMKFPKSNQSSVKALFQQLCCVEWTPLASVILPKRRIKDIFAFLDDDDDDGHLGFFLFLLINSFIIIVIFNCVHKKKTVCPTAVFFFSFNGTCFIWGNK